MRTINLVGICSMALMLAATAFSAGCTTDSGGEGGAGGESPTTTTTTGGEGGNGEGGNGEGGNGEGGNGEGGSGTCVVCLEAFEGAEGDLCAASEPKYDALAECICGACGANEGDPCYAVCSMTGEMTEECNECGVMAATDDAGACTTEGTACIADEGT